MRSHVATFTVAPQMLSALGIATLIAACSSSGSSGTITPSGVIPDLQTGMAQSSGPVVAEFVYVPNLLSENISAYKVKSGGALTPITGSPFSVGTNPNAIAVDPKGEFAYVANGAGSSGSVSAFTINASTGALTQVHGSPFSAGDGPNGVAVDPTGKFVYVPNLRSYNISAYKINASSGALTSVTGSPFSCNCNASAVAVDPKGKFVYIPAYEGVFAYTISISTGALTEVLGSPFPAGTIPNAVAVDPTGKFAYVPNLALPSESSYNISAYTIKAITGALAPVAGSPFAAGISPDAVAIDPTGKFVYVANIGPETGGAGNVSAYAINASSGALTPAPGSPFAAGTWPYAVAVDPTDKFVYVPNLKSDNVSAYQIESGGVLKPLARSPFAAGSYPISIATCRVTAGKCIPPPL